MQKEIWSKTRWNLWETVNIVLINKLFTRFANTLYINNANSKNSYKLHVSD